MKLEGGFRFPRLCLSMRTQSCKGKTEFALHRTVCVLPGLDDDMDGLECHLAETFGEGVSGSVLLSKIKPFIQEEAVLVSVSPSIHGTQHAVCHHTEATGVDVKLALKVVDKKKRGRLSTEEREKYAKNAHRDMKRRFVKKGLSLPVTIQSIDHCVESEEFETHYIPVSEWIRVLLEDAPEALFGKVPDYAAQLSSWWTLYQQHHPGHQVFEAHSTELHRVIPILLYGDEGHGPKRGNFLVWSCETPFGIEEPEFTCDCSSCLDALPETTVTHLYGPDLLPTKVVERALKQSTNYPAHSYVTKHLLFGIPHWMYKQEGGKAVIHLHLEKVAADLTQLFETGISVLGASPIPGLSNLPGCCVLSFQLSAHVFLVVVAVFQPCEVSATTWQWWGRKGI